MAKGRFRRHGDTAVPVGKEGQSALRAIPDGGDFMADFRTARNPLQHDLFWSLCDLVAYATDTTKVAVKEWLLEKTGFVDLIFYPDGSMKVCPKSIAWESMEQVTFDQFFRVAVYKIAELLGNAPADVWKQFEDLLDRETRAVALKRFKRLRRAKSPPTVPADDGPADSAGTALASTSSEAGRT